MAVSDTKLHTNFGPVPSGRFTRSPAPFSRPVLMVFSWHLLHTRFGSVPTKHPMRFRYLFKARPSGISLLTLASLPWVSVRHSHTSDLDAYLKTHLAMFP